MREKTIIISSVHLLPHFNFYFLYFPLRLPPSLPPSQDRLYAAGGEKAIDLRGSGFGSGGIDASEDSADGDDDGIGGDKSSAGESSGGSGSSHAGGSNWADDRRLMKESLLGAPKDALALLRQRLEALRQRAKAFPGALAVKHFDSPFQYAPQPEDLQILSRSSSSSPSGRLSGGGGGRDSFSADAAVVGAALGGASAVTVGIRDAFLTFMAMLVGHYRQFVLPPSKLLALNNISTTGGKTAEALERMGIDEWFDFTAFGEWVVVAHTIRIIPLLVSER